MGAKRKKKPAKSKKVSSPIATGGSGTFFEQHVNAMYLALLLTGTVPPVLTDCVLVEVSFQAERLGWQTDDVLLVGEKADGTRRNLATQVKRAFNLSLSDEDCKKVLKDFWNDFNDRNRFVEGQDSLALVALTGGNSATHLRTLSDSARAAKGPSDLIGRITSEGFHNVGVRRAFDTVRTVLSNVAAVPLSDDQLWRVLKSIHVLILDLDTSASHIVALIKSLLSLSATGTDKVRDADVTWNELLALVSERMPRAATITRDTLPKDMRNRHNAVPAPATDAMRKAREHSDITLRRISTTLGGGVSIDRTEALATLVEAVSESAIVLVTGPAGSGKSALAKLAIESLSEAAFVLAFRAEELAAVHLDQALLHAQIPTNAETLNAVLAGQARKVLLIESVERLLEATYREAFDDLLRMCADGGTWQIIITCRDYSLDDVRTSFLGQSRIPTTIFRTPPLSDTELDAAIKELPALRRPASHPFLRQLFRMPYILDKAARMDWPEGGRLPDDERTFRKKFWREVVRREDRALSALPQRRERAFLDVCLRRAKLLEPFAPCGDLDQEAISELRKDGLIEHSPATDALAAPAHDALEDWAVIEWISKQFAVSGTNRGAFAEQLGTFPAIRRGYRKWLGEFLAHDPTTADAYVIGALNDPSLSAFFKDDTLVAVLLADTAGDFISRRGASLTTNKGELIRRVIHLLRVACKATPPWVNRGAESVWFQPSGPAWAATLAIVHAQLSLFLPRDINLVVGLIADWAGGVSWWNPIPDGASDGAGIAHKLLPHLEHYSARELLDQVLKVIVKVPTGDSASFLRLAERAAAPRRTDALADEFAELLLSGFDSAFACQYQPDAVIRVAEARFLRSTGTRGESLPSLERIDASFGIRDTLTHEYFPVSALQGPFLALLRYHPAKAVQFIVRLLNRCTECYAEPSGHPPRREPWKIQLKLPDGTFREYWFSARLWNLYRGLSTGPHVLTCALMALESFLLERGKGEGTNLEEWLIYLMKEANNAAVLAVVASAAMAFPSRAARIGLSLLTSKDVIAVDHQRMINESLSSFEFPMRTTLQEMMDAERKTSAELPHRRDSLEMLAFRLQTGPLRDEVWALLDAYMAALPALERQDDGDRLWRIALKRMDSRAYRARKATPEENDLIAKLSPAADAKAHVLLEPGPLESDLKEFVEKDYPDQKQFSDLSSLWVWGHKAFRYEATSGDDWQANLKAARAIAAPRNRGRVVDRWGAEAPVFVAAVCARDHWPELKPRERRWCTDVLVGAILKDAATEDVSRQSSRGDMHGDAAAASVLPHLLKHDVGEEVHKALIATLMVAMAHAVPNVVMHASAGIAHALAADDPELVRGFLGIIVRQATRLAALWAAEKGVPYPQRRDYRALRTIVTREFLNSDADLMPCTEAELAEIDVSEWPGIEAYKVMMPMLANCPNEALARQEFRYIADTLAKTWTAQRRHEERRDFYFEGDCEAYLASFVLKLPLEEARFVLTSIVASVDNSPDEVASFIKDLIGSVDRLDDPGQFWHLWKDFADRVARAPWLHRLEDRHPADRGLLQAMFLGIPWKKDVTHWRHLDKQSGAIEELFEKLPPVATVFSAFAAFLYDIGEASLPGAFVILERRLRAAGLGPGVFESSAVHRLETILKRYVYGRPATLKSEPSLRTAVLYLLDRLVDAGSSAAYRMRDDFVTPGKQATDCN